MRLIRFLVMCVLFSIIAIWILRIFLTEGKLSFAELSSIAILIGCLTANTVEIEYKIDKLSDEIHELKREV